MSQCVSHRRGKDRGRGREREKGREEGGGGKERGKEKGEGAGVARKADVYVTGAALYAQR